MAGPRTKAGTAAPRGMTSLRVVMDKDLLAQVDALARDRRLDRDQLVEIALRNLLTLHDWPASRGTDPRPAPMTKRAAAARPRDSVLDPAEVDRLKSSARDAVD